MVQRRILIVDDDPEQVQLMSRCLKDLGDIVVGTDGAEGLRLARQATPSVVLLDAQMAGMSGFELFVQMRKDPSLAKTPIIFVTGHSEPDFEVDSISRGAADFIAKPFVPAVLRARVEAQLRLKAKVDNLYWLIGTDAVVGCANAHKLEEAIEREWKSALRHGEPIALLLIEIDAFSDYCQRNGNDAGNACLMQVVAAAKQTSQRAADLLARIQGGEFALLLPRTDGVGAKAVAARIAECLAASASSMSATTIHVPSLSIGIASHEERSAAPSHVSSKLRSLDPCDLKFDHANLMLAADEAVRDAKRSGGGQVRLINVTDFVSDQSADEARMPRLEICK